LPDNTIVGNSHEKKQQDSIVCREWLTYSNNEV
jgi:hypothetical protein